MRIPFRALLLTAVATGAYALVLRRVAPRPEPVRTPIPTGIPEIDAERLAEAERDALVRELSDQL